MRELPPPLPPEERTVVQLVAETIRAYGAQFWRVLPLGLPVAVATQISLGRSDERNTLTLLALSPAFALAFVVACSLVVGGGSRRVVVIALVIFLPVPISSASSAGLLARCSAWRAGLHGRATRV
jgi:hypothetical protein